jgi:CubicO group peptidase (beta-lactamase class C family)
MHKRATVALAVLLVCATSLIASDAVDQYIQRGIKQRNIPGLSLAAIRDGRMIKLAGYGRASLELDAPAAGDTVYEIGSITKQFTAEAVMLLVEDGRLGLDDPIARYLPPTPDSWRPITIRHLLTHTSGLRDWEAAGVLPYHAEYTPSDYIALIARYPLDFPPGEQFRYTNSGFPLLGMIVERASGEPYTAFVISRILRPLGLTATRFKDPGEVVTGRAEGYIFRDGVFRRGEQPRPAVIAPNGGIMTTAADLASWAASVLNGRLLRPASLREMLTPVRLNSGRTVNHGFAWFMTVFNGHRIILHPGTTIGGYSAVVYHYPDDRLTVVALANLDDGAFGVDTMVQRVADSYVPGVWLSGLKRQPDPDRQETKALVDLLKSVAEGGNPDQLLPTAQAALTPALRAETASRLKAQTTFECIGEERCGPSHFVLGPDVDRFRRYRMVTGGRVVYYTFSLTHDGKVVGFRGVAE